MSSYFSISDILAEEERIPCKWHVAAKGVGYLDPSTGTEVGFILYHICIHIIEQTSTEFYSYCNYE